jgi:hypothetical protein
MGSNYSKAAVNPPAEISEKQMIIERLEAPKSDKPSVDVEQALTSDNITKWTNALEDVSFILSNGLSEMLICRTPHSPYLVWSCHRWTRSRLWPPGRPSCMMRRYSTSISRV